MTTLHVSVAQAALGTEVELDTLDGPYPLTVPAGVQTGRVLKIAGHGVPRLRGGAARGPARERLCRHSPQALEGRGRAAAQARRPTWRTRAAARPGPFVPPPLRLRLSVAGRAPDARAPAAAPRSSSSRTSARPALAQEDAHHLGEVLRSKPVRRSRSLTAPARGGCVPSPRPGPPGAGHAGYGLAALGLDVAGRVHQAAPPCRSSRSASRWAKAERTEWAVAKLVELGVDVPHAARGRPDRRATRRQ